MGRGKLILLGLAACALVVAGLSSSDVLPCGAPLQSDCSTTPAAASTGVELPGQPRTTLTPLPAPAPGESLFGMPNGRLPYGFNTSAIELNHDDPSHRRGASATAIAVIHQAVGATLARVNLFWPTVEPQPHHYTWSYYDNIYAALTSHGVRPIWTLIKTPRFYVPVFARLGCTGLYCDAEPAPRYRGELASLSRRIAQRYPLSAAIELRNEPNNPPTLATDKPKVAPDVYTAELQQVFKGTRASNTSVRVLGGALGDTNRVGYLEAMLRDGAGAAMDGLSFHPYDQTPGFSRFPAWFDDLDAALKGTGHEDLRLVADETGVSTDHAQATDGFKAARLIQIYNDLNDRDNSLPLVDDVDAVLFYTAVDPPDISHGFGWFLSRQESADGDLSPKAVYCAFRTQVGHFSTPFAGAIVAPGERIDPCES